MDWTRRTLLITLAFLSLGAGVAGAPAASTTGWAVSKALDR